LLIALMIVHGFKAVISDKTLFFAPNLTIETYGGERILRADTLVQWAQQQTHIATALAIVQAQGMVQVGDNIEGSFIKGVPQAGDLTGVPHLISQGQFDVALQAGSPTYGIVLGARLARNLKAEIGDLVTLYASSALPSAEQLPTLRQFVLTGIYQTGIEQFDDVTVYMDIDQARLLFDFAPTEASFIELKATQQDLIEPINQAMNQQVTFPYYVASIYESHANIFAWINLQEQTIPVIIGVLILIAAFNLIGAVLMMVLERTRDIGILKTMGATDPQVRRIFMLEGLWVALWGLTLGMGIALLFYWLQATWQLIPLSEENYYMAYAPVKLQRTDFLWVSGITLLLCLFASWLPAGVAARLKPLSVIHFGRG
jgi:lipoprotein-releasing system permease protein